MTSRRLPIIPALLAAAALPASALADGPAAAPASLQAFAATVTATAAGGLQVHVDAVGHDGPNAAALTALTGRTVALSLTGATRLLVTDVNADGAISPADVAVGDHVIVRTADALAVPVVAATLLDRTHQPTSGGDAPRPAPVPAPAPAPAPPPHPTGDGGRTTGGHTGEPGHAAAGPHREATTPTSSDDPGATTTGSPSGGDTTAPAAAGATPPPPRRVAGLLRRALRFHAHVDTVAGGVLGVTVDAFAGLPKRLAAQGARLEGRQGRVLVTDETVVVSGGVVLTGDARAAALAVGADVALAGRLTAPSTWPRNADGVRVPTLRARRIVILTAAATTTTTPGDGGTTGDAPLGDPGPVAV